MTTWALVDGGGSKTRVRIVDAAHGNTVFEQISGPGNLTLGADQVWNSIQQGLAAAPTQPPTRLFAGLAGVESAGARAAFLAKTQLPTTLVSDRDSGLLGALAGAPGACLTVGTGVALSWLTGDGSVYRRGGLGFVLGDAGGGAWIGRRMLQILAHQADRGIESDGVQAVIDAFGIGPGLADWVSFGQQATPAEFAALAPHVFSLADSGSALAQRIVAEGTAALLETLEGLPAELPIALVGGLTPCYQDRLRARGLPIVSAKGDALDGLWLEASGLVRLAIERWSTDGSN